MTTINNDNHRIESVLELRHVLPISGIVVDIEATAKLTYENFAKWDMLPASTQEQWRNLTRYRTGTITRQESAVWDESLDDPWFQTDNPTDLHDNTFDDETTNITTIVQGDQS